MSDVLQDAEGGWKSFDTTQRTAAFVAGAMTLARPALAAAAATKSLRDGEASWGSAALAAGAFATDTDGTVARTFNAVTEFGKIVDPFADKVAMTIVEAANARRRGRLATALLIVRATRDVTVSLVRRSALTNGCNGDDVKANGYGRAGTFVRMGVAVTGSSPLSESHPRLVDAADIASTALNVFSGVVTIKRVWQSRSHRRAKAASQAVKP